MLSNRSITSSGAKHSGGSFKVAICEVDRIKTSDTVLDCDIEQMVVRNVPCNRSLSGCHPIDGNILLFLRDNNIIETSLPKEPINEVQINANTFRWIRDSSFGCS
jgi:hypothetical protein